MQHFTSSCRFKLLVIFLAPDVTKEHCNEPSLNTRPSASVLGRLWWGCGLSADVYNATSAPQSCRVMLVNITNLDCAVVPSMPAMIGALLLTVIRYKAAERFSISHLFLLTVCLYTTLTLVISQTHKRSQEMDYLSLVLQVALKREFFLLLSPSAHTGSSSCWVFSALLLGLYVTV